MPLILPGVIFFEIIFSSRSFIWVFYMSSMLLIMFSFMSKHIKSILTAVLRSFYNNSIITVISVLVLSIVFFLPDYWLYYTGCIILFYTPDLSSLNAELCEFYVSEYGLWILCNPLKNVWFYCSV